MFNICVLMVLVACEDSRPGSCLYVGVGILSWNGNLVGIGGREAVNNVFVSLSNIYSLYHGPAYQNTNHTSIIYRTSCISHYFQSSTHIYHQQIIFLPEVLILSCFVTMYGPNSFHQH